VTGPDKGGPYGPYRQSERTEIYNKLVNELLQKGMAFPCFCSDEEIDQSRRDAEKRNLPPVYRGKWAQASSEVHPYGGTRPIPSSLPSDKAEGNKTHH
jgi:glutamyl-tRNA synthetase